MILILRNVSVAIFSPLQFPSSIYICVSFGIARILSRMTDGVLGSSIRGDVRCLLLKKRIIYSTLFITKFAIYFEVFRIFFWGIKISLLLSDIIMMMMMRCDADDRHQDNGGGWGFFLETTTRQIWWTRFYIPSPLPLFWIVKPLPGPQRRTTNTVVDLWSYRCCCRYSSATVFAWFRNNNAAVIPQQHRGRKNSQDGLCVLRWLIKSIMECWVVVWLVVALVCVVVVGEKGKKAKK